MRKHILQHSDKPFEELALAQQSVEQMKKAKGTREFEVAWKLFLQYLEKTWNKADAHFVQSPNWNNWSGHYVRARKKDSLLSYLKQARDSDQHGITDITKKVAGRMSMRPVAPGGDFYLQELSFDERGNISRLEPGSPMILRVVKPKMALIPFHHRGVDYPVPTTHLGEVIKTEDPIAIAELAIAYYEIFLRAAEAQFVTL